jgi:Lrp/AsnC family transcriptional regulator for asnA, asnC and gidA
MMVTIKAHSLDDLHEIVAGKIGTIDGVIRTETFIELKTIQKEPAFEQQ